MEGPSEEHCLICPATDADDCEDETRPGAADSESPPTLDEGEAWAGDRRWVIDSHRFGTARRASMIPKVRIGRDRMDTGAPGRGGALLGGGNGSLDGAMWRVGRNRIESHGIREMQLDPSGDSGDIAPKGKGQQRAVRTWLATAGFRRLLRGREDAFVRLSRRWVSRGVGQSPRRRRPVRARKASGRWLGRR
jgi:hypothetical protein